MGLSLHRQLAEIKATSLDVTVQAQVAEDHYRACFCDETHLEKSSASWRG
jgi:hypothetical protein